MDIEFAEFMAPPGSAKEPGDARNAAAPQPGARTAAPQMRIARMCSG